jgi:hypothetical protein
MSMNLQTAVIKVLTKIWPGLIFTLCIVAVVILFWVSSFVQTKDLKMQEQIVTAKTDFTELTQLTAIAGHPSVLWARLPMGRIDQNGRFPGPTDLAVYAVLDYGTKETADRILLGAEGQPEALSFDSEPVRYNWFPKPVLDTLAEGEITVVQYGMLEKFGYASISRFVDAPRFLLLIKPLP